MDVSNNLCTNRGKPSVMLAIESGKIGPTNTADIFNANAARINFSKQGVVHLKGYLNTDIATSNKWLVDGASVRIVLEPARNNCVINAVNNAVCWKNEILSVKLHAKKFHHPRVVI